jgi:hypothetical protein
MYIQIPLCMLPTMSKASQTFFFVKVDIAMLLCILCTLHLAGCSGEGVKVDSQGALIHWAHDTSKEKVYEEAGVVCREGYSVVKEDHLPASWVLQFKCAGKSDPRGTIAAGSPADPPDVGGSAPTSAQPSSGADSSSNDNTVSAVVGIFGSLLNIKAAQTNMMAVKAEQLAAQRAAVAARIAAQATVATQQQNIQQKGQGTLQQSAQTSVTHPNTASNASPAYVNTSAGVQIASNAPLGQPQFNSTSETVCSDGSDMSTCVYNVQVQNLSSQGINCAVDVTFYRYNSVTSGSDTLSARDVNFVPAGQSSIVSSNPGYNGGYSNLICSY